MWRYYDEGRMISRASNIYVLVVPNLITIAVINCTCNYNWNN